MNRTAVRVRSQCLLTRVEVEESSRPGKRLLDRTQGYAMVDDICKANRPASIGEIGGSALPLFRIALDPMKVANDRGVGCLSGCILIGLLHLCG